MSEPIPIRSPLPAAAPAASPPTGSSPAAAASSPGPDNGPRCGHAGCPKRLTLLAQSVGKCRCGGVFCRRHHDTHAHQCTYDFKKEHQDALTSRLAAESATAGTKGFYRI